MNLKKETVATAYLDFATRFGWPEHAKNTEIRRAIIAIDHRELSKHFTEETFKDGLTVAWTKTRRFPAVADFFAGYGGKEPNDYGVGAKERKRLGL